jgi:hypothetical protein
MVPTVYGFEHDFYDGFYVTYGNCNSNAESNIIQTFILLQKVEDQYCIDRLFSNSKLEYVATLDNAIVVETKSETWKLDLSDDAVYPDVLPKNWNEGDSIKWTPDIELEYNGIKSKIINGKSVDVYLFKSFRTMDGSEPDSAGITMSGESNDTLTYETKTGILISHSMNGKIILNIPPDATTESGIAWSEFGEENVTVIVTGNLDAIDISEEPKQASGGCGTGTVLVDGVCQLAPQESNDGCGAGTVMVNGVCQLAKTSSPFNILSGSTIEPLYIVIGAVAVGAAIIGIVFAVRRGSSGTSTPKPARQDVEDYESQYLARQGQRPSRKPAETGQTSWTCNNCGARLKPIAKFCGQCGTPRS